MVRDPARTGACWKPGRPSCGRPAYEVASGGRESGPRSRRAGRSGHAGAGDLRRAERGGPAAGAARAAAVRTGPVGAGVEGPDAAAPGAHRGVRRVVGVRDRDGELISGHTAAGRRDRGGSRELGVHWAPPDCARCCAICWRIRSAASRAASAAAAAALALAIAAAAASCWYVIAHRRGDSPAGAGRRSRYDPSQDRTSLSLSGMGDVSGLPGGVRSTVRQAVFRCGSICSAGRETAARHHHARWGAGRRRLGTVEALGCDLCPFTSRACSGPTYGREGKCCASQLAGSACRSCLCPLWSFKEQAVIRQPRFRGAPAPGRQVTPL